MRSFGNDGYLGDGLCYLQTVLAGGASSGTASTTDIGVAANALIKHCVVSHGVGGIVSHIGRPI